MNLFLLGLDKSGRTTLAKHLSNRLGYNYIDATTNTYRCNYCIDWVNDEKVLKGYHSNNKNYITDGITSPRDFASLFESEKDMVVFLNRLDNNSTVKDCDAVGISVMRDYCYWMASAGLLSKSNWLEYNFKLNGDDSLSIKTLGSKNTVIIVKSFNKVIEHLTEYLKDLK